MSPLVKWWKVLYALAGFTLGATALGFALQDNPFPRPLFVVVGMAITLSLLAVGGAIASRKTLPIGVFLILLAGYFLRSSKFSRVVSSGLDHGRWMNVALEFVDAGNVVGSDMYAASPLYILDLVVWYGVVDGPIFQTRFLTILAASFLPLFVGLLAYRLTDDALVGYVTVLLSAMQPLFLRTAALLEAEFMALGWFVLGVYLLVRCLQTDDRRYYGLLLLVGGTAVVVHFYYGVVLSVTLGGALGAIYLLRRVDRNHMPLEVPSASVGLVVLAIGVITSSWILWSGYARTAVVFTQESSRTISLLPAFFPTTGVVAESTGGPASISGPVGEQLSTVARLYPAVSLLVVAGVGVVVLSQRERSAERTILFALAGTTAAMTFVTLAVRFGNDLGFRMYYFLTVFLVLFAAVGLSSGLRVTGGYRAIVAGGVVLFVLSYALVAPVSPLGNNVDPAFGGTSWATTETEYAQLQSLDGQFGGTEPMTSSLTEAQLHPSLLPTAPSDDLYATPDECADDWQISDTGGYAVCHR